MNSHTTASAQQPPLCHGHTAIVTFFDVVGFSQLLSHRSPELVFEHLMNIWTTLDRHFSALPGRTLYLFSDCGFLLCAVEDGDRDKLLIEALGDVKTILDEYLAFDFLLRGAISVGNVVHGPGLLVGTPVVAAVRYEELYNPGPFILVPTVEKEKLIARSDFISDLPDFEIQLKNESETMLASIVCPSDTMRYVGLLGANLDTFLRSGPYSLATFYSRAFRFLRLHRPEWFDSQPD